VLYVLFALSLPFLYQFRRTRPRTLEEKQRQKSREARIVAVAGALLLVLLSIAYEPWLGVPLLGVTLGGIGCAFLIRRMNRSA
jgi:Na+/H+ antiporter NhaD/arsenite permease-like protein